MYLVRLIYASEVSELFKPSDIEDILKSARINNAKRGISGLLCFNNRYFLQCLEGSRQVVNEVYQTIVKDSRHHNMLLLNYGEIIQRDFEQWSMAYVSANKINSAANMRFSSSPDFNPYEMSGESCRHFLVALRETVAKVE